jgi:hypothetical protein
MMKQRNALAMVHVSLKVNRTNMIANGNANAKVDLLAQIVLNQHVQVTALNVVNAVMVFVYVQLDIQVKAVNYALCVDQAVSVLIRNTDTATKTKWSVYAKKASKVLIAYTRPTVAALVPRY